MDIIADYCIAEHNVRVVFAENGKNNTELLPSFEPFKKEGSNDDFSFYATRGRHAGSRG